VERASTYSDAGVATPAESSDRDASPTAELGGGTTADDLLREPRQNMQSNLGDQLRYKHTPSISSPSL
jgi:hypothetical protein